MTLERIDYPFNGSTISLIPTEGATFSDCGKIVGLFSDEADALSDDPDSAAWGIVGWDTLTPEQQAIATRNTNALPSD